MSRAFFAGHGGSSVRSSLPHDVLVAPVPRRVLSQVKSVVLGWACWSFGVILIPIGAFAVPADPGYALPPVFFGGERDLAVWLIWAVAFVAMSLAMRQLRDAAPRALIIGLALGGSVVAFAPALDSHDPYAYLLYGEMAMHGANPWNPVTVTIWNATTAQGVRPWGNPPVASVYGPAFIAVEAAVVATFHSATTYELLLVQRIISLSAALGITALLRGRQRAIWALHPLVLFETAFGAHNDVLMLLPLALAMRLHNSLGAGVALACGTCVKIVGVATTALRPRSLLAVAVTLGIVFAFGHSSLGIAQLKHHQELTPLNSPVMLLRAVFDHTLHLRFGTVLAKGIVWVAASAAILSLVIRRRRSNMAAIALLVVGAIPIIYPWYFLWPLCAATIAQRRFAESVAGIAAASFLLDLPAFVAPTFALEYGATVGLVLFAAVSLWPKWRPA
jgi:hypothetical protein